MWLNYLIHESDEGLNTSDKLQSQQDAPFKENIESGIIFNILIIIIMIIFMIMIMIIVFNRK